MTDIETKLRQQLEHAELVAKERALRDHARTTLVDAFKSLRAVDWETEARVARSIFAWEPSVIEREQEYEQVYKSCARFVAEVEDGATAGDVYEAAGRFVAEVQEVVDKQRERALAHAEALVRIAGERAEG